MRAFVTRGGIPTFISNREDQLIETIGEKMFKSEMNEQQAETARVLTSRGVLQRFMDTDHGIYYTPNQNKNFTEE